MIESQNLTIQLLCEEIDNLQHSTFGSYLNPDAEIFIPSTDAQPPAQPTPVPDSTVLLQAQEIRVSDLIPTEDSLSAEPAIPITDLSNLPSSPRVMWDPAFSEATVPRDY